MVADGDAVAAAMAVVEVVDLDTEAFYRSLNLLWQHF